jgi:hypothetical protein
MVSAERNDFADAIYLIAEDSGWYGVVPVYRGLADAILERFDVTPKPVISDETLGQFMQELNLGIDGWQYPKYRECIGRRLRNRLEDAGLEIVKVNE